MKINNIKEINLMVKIFKFNYNKKYILIKYLLKYNNNL